MTNILISRKPMQTFLSFNWLARRPLNHLQRAVLLSIMSLSWLLSVSVSAQVSGQTITVAADGSGDFKTVQAALASVPDNGTNPFTIFIKPGTYQGQFMVGKEKRHVRLIGQDLEKTILTWPYNVNDRKPNQPYQFDPGFVVVGDDLYAENLTIENTSGDHGQALAVRVDADRSVFNNCRILGWQDTLMVNEGRHYFTNCFIAGRVDFIYGSGTSVFDRCEIHSKNGGYITAASTPQDQPFGFVFLNCKLTGDPTPWQGSAAKPQFEASDVKTYLGRPWRSSGSVCFINCEMGRHIKPEGWHNWGKVENEATARYVEYNNTGPGANPATRVKWAKQLSDADAKAYTLKNIFKRADEWQPNLSLDMPKRLAQQ